MASVRSAGYFAITFGVVALVAASATCADASARPDLALVNRADGPSGANGNGPAWTPSISANGRWVAFSSRATNLSQESVGCYENIFVRDLKLNTTELATPAGSIPGADVDDFIVCEYPQISGDGRFVAFTTRYGPYSSFLPGVFVRDLVTNTTTRVSATQPDDADPADGYSSSPSISNDGRFVAFASLASNLKSDDAESRSDVFLRDTASGTTSLVTSTSDPLIASEEDYGAPSISSNGSTIAFVRRLWTTSRVLLRDLATGSTERIGLAPSGNRVPGSLTANAVSADGTRIAFTSVRDVRRPGDRYSYAIYVRDRARDRTISAMTSGFDESRSSRIVLGAEISADGNRVAFQYSPEFGKKYHAVISDLATGAISRVRGAVGSDLSISLADNGRRLAFQSREPGLHPDDVSDRGGTADIFVARLPR